MFTIRKYRASSQLIFLSLAWIWVIVMSFIERSHSTLGVSIEPLSKLILSIAPPQSIENAIVALLIILVESIYLSYIFQTHDLIEQNNWIPSILYLVLSGISGTYELSPLVISNLFILLTIDRLFESYNSSKGIDNIMLASFYVSIATLFYFPTIIFIIGIWLGLFVLRNLNWRYFTASLIGLLIPIIYLLTWFFLNDQLTNEIQSYSTVLRDFVNKLNHIQSGNIIILAVSLFYTFITVVHLFTSQQGKLIKKRKKAGIVIVFSVIAVFSLFISYEPVRKSLITLMLVMSGAISIEISEIKSNISSSLIFWTLLCFYIIANLGIL